MNTKWLLYIRQFEGFAPLPYKDSTGHLTVGYGHNLDVPLSKQGALKLLELDVRTARENVARVFTWFEKLNEVRQFVLVDMCFNMGLKKLSTFKKFLAALEVKNYDLAAQEMLNSRWALQVGRRARILAEMMKIGAYK